MRLTTYTDYALRTLMYLAEDADRLATIQDIASVHRIPKNHLTKVVHQLGVAGFVETVRGRNGGLRLARKPAEITIGDVVRHTETDFNMAECFDRNNIGCVLSSACALKGVLVAATDAYLDILDRTTLESVVAKSLPTVRPAGKPVQIRMVSRAGSQDR